MTDCAINGAKASYWKTCCYFYQNRAILFSLRAPNFKLLRNHNSVHKVYSVNLALYLVFLHFIHLIAFSCPRSYCFISKILFFTLPTLVSKENLEMIKDRNPCRESEGREKRRGRGWGGWTAGEWVEETCHQHFWALLPHLINLRPGCGHWSFLWLLLMTSRPSSFTSEDNWLSSLLAHIVILPL